MRPARLARRTALNATAWAIALIMLFPVYWMVASAVNGTTGVANTPRLIPRDVSFENFRLILEDDVVTGFWDALQNSLIVAGSATVIALALAFLAALALARVHFRGRGAYLLGILVLQMIPLTVLIIPMYVMFSRVPRPFGEGNLPNTLTAVSLSYIALTLPFCIWIMRGFLVSIPRELEEASMVDGTTRFGSFRRILLPLAYPGLVATAIWALIQAWNEFMLAAIILDDRDKATLSYWFGFGIAPNVGDYSGVVAAAATLIALPVVLLFLLIHRKVVHGLAGAVKG